MDVVITIISIQRVKKTKKYIINKNVYIYSFFIFFRILTLCLDLFRFGVATFGTGCDGGLILFSDPGTI